MLRDLYRFGYCSRPHQRTVPATILEIQQRWLQPRSIFKGVSGRPKALSTSHNSTKKSKHNTSSHKCDKAHSHQPLGRQPFYKSRPASSKISATHWSCSKTPFEKRCECELYSGNEQESGKIKKSRGI